MKEIEIKILDIDPKQIAEKLLKLEAEQTFKGLLKVRYFDTDDSEILKRGELLRVRQFEGSHVEVCFKNNKRVIDGCKVFDEYQMKAKNFEEATKMLEAMGYVVACSYEKRRTVFKLKDAEVVIDEYPKIPPFIEIEAKDSERIEELIKALELTQNEQLPYTINELLKEKYPDIKLNNLTF